jgi:drug/metabolite transporter (DMT)-like permease
MTLLKRKLYRHHFTALASIVLGVSIVGYSYITDGTNESKNIVLGIIVLQIGQIFGSIAYVTEEKILGQYKSLNPLMLAVGEGLTGCLIFLTVLPILQFVPCTNEQLCTNGQVADTMQAFRDFAANPILILYAIGMCFFCTFLITAQMLIVKFGSAAQKTMADILRPIVIWVFFMNVKIYDIEKNEWTYREHFRWMQLGGYVVIIAGILVYNEILVIPIWGFNENTKIAIEERKNAPTLIQRSNTVHHDSFV